MRTTLVMAVAIILTLVQCTKSTTVSQDKSSNEELVRTYSRVGSLHNAALEVIQKKVASNRKNRSRTGNQMRTTGEFLQPEELKEITDNYLEETTGFEGAEQINYMITKKFVLNPDISTYWVDVEQNFNVVVPTTVENFGIEITNAINSDATADQIDALMNNYINQEISELDKISIISMASVAKSSSEYWAVNLPLWEALGASTARINGRAMGKINPKSVVIADVLGAGTGAIRGAVIGAVGGTVLLPGIGTVGGAAAVGMISTVGGAITGSASAAVGSWFESLFD